LTKKSYYVLKFRYMEF